MLLLVPFCTLSQKKTATTTTEQHAYIQRYILIKLTTQTSSSSSSSLLYVVKIHSFYSFIQSFAFMEFRLPLSLSRLILRAACCCFFSFSLIHIGVDASYTIESCEIFYNFVDFHADSTWILSMEFHRERKIFTNAANAILLYLKMELNETYRI